MREEEIIKNTKAILENWQKILDIEDDIERDIEMNCYIEEMPFKELQGLLDLYQKEKEKNRQSKMRIVQLENEITARIEDVNKYFISKDEIRKLLEEKGILEERN